MKFTRSTAVNLVDEPVDVVAVVLIVLAVRQQLWWPALSAAVLISVRFGVRRAFVSRLDQQPATATETDKPSGRKKAADLVGVLVSVAGVVLATLNYAVEYDDAHSQTNIAEEGQSSDRLTADAKVLAATGNADLTSRIGGIEDLKELARDSPGERPAVIDVLSGFVNSHTAEPNSGPTACPDRPIPNDVQEALAALIDSSRGDGAVVNLSGLCLDGSDLRRMNLDHADLSGSDFDNAQFDDARLRGARLGGAYFQDAKFPRANFTGDSFDGVTFAGADFVADGYDHVTNEPANLHGVRIGAANLGGANLAGEQLAGQDMRKSVLEGAYLMGAHLEGAHFEHVDARSACFTDAHLEGAHFNGARLGKLDASTPAADFTGADLRGTDFTGADTTGVTGLAQGPRSTSDHCS